MEQRGCEPRKPAAARGGERQRGPSPGTFRGSTGLLTPSSWTSHLQDRERMSACCLKPPMCGHLSWQPQEAGTEQRWVPGPVGQILLRFMVGDSQWGLCSTGDKAGSQPCLLGSKDDSEPSGLAPGVGRKRWLCASHREGGLLWPRRPHPHSPWVCSLELLRDTMLAFKPVFVCFLRDSAALNQQLEAIWVFLLWLLVHSLHSRIVLLPAEGPAEARLSAARVSEQ